MGGRDIESVLDGNAEQYERGREILRREDLKHMLKQTRAPSLLWPTLIMVLLGIGSFRLVIMAGEGSLQEMATTWMLITGVLALFWVAWVSQLRHNALEKKVEMLIELLDERL